MDEPFWDEIDNSAAEEPFTSRQRVKMTNAELRETSSNEMDRLRSEVTRWKNEAFRSANECAEKDKLRKHIEDKSAEEITRLAGELAEAKKRVDAANDCGADASVRAHEWMRAYNSLLVQLPVDIAIKCAVRLPVPEDLARVRAKAKADLAKNLADSLRRSGDDCIGLMELDAIEKKYRREARE